MKISSLLAHVHGVSPIPYIDKAVGDLCLDSRKVKPGDAFFALLGEKLDGTVYIEEAVTRGAILIFKDGPKAEVTNEQNVLMVSIPQLKDKLSEIAAFYYGYPAKKMKMVGITGTSGKTSCAYFMASLLSQLNIPAGYIGTLGFGMMGDIQAGSLTTPDAISLQKILVSLLEQGAKVIIMEVSSHSLEQGRVKSIEFLLGVLTNFSRDHLDYHKTMEAYGKAKKRLFKQTKWAILNVDDPLGKELIAEKLCQYFSYGTTTADVVAKNISLTDKGIQAEIISPWGQGAFVAPLIGKFNLENLLAVISALSILEIPLPTILKSLSSLKSVPGRMELIREPGQPLVVVDYAHKPDALEKVLTALRAHTNGRLYCIFGCGGNRDRGKRALMAKIAEKYADKIVVTDDNPRHEDAKQIVAEIMQGFTSLSQVTVQHNRAEAISLAVKNATANDCILIAGKGSETYQQIGDEKYPFSDIEKVKTLFKNSMIENIRRD